MNVIAVIPARMGSTRFPGKPMENILGRPMIEYVYSAVAQCTLIDRVVVATCDEVIADFIASIGGEAVMTSPGHERASDRVAEAVETLESAEQVSFDIVVLVQGDEPMTDPKMIEEAVIPMLENPSLKIINLIAPIKDIAELTNSNCIKVVTDVNDFALYFSRSAIPNTGSEPMTNGRKQVCVIPFRRDFLAEYTAMKPTPLEQHESIDMLRVLENGEKVKMIETAFQTHAVDVPADIQLVENALRSKV